jgi:hypothetical protein
MGWIHETRERVKVRDPLSVAADNMTAYYTEEAMKAFVSFENGENPSLKDLKYSHTLGMAVYDGVHPSLLYRKGGEIQEISSNDELFSLWDLIRTANKVEVEVSEVTEAIADDMTFDLQEAICAVKRRFPEFAERIGNADIISDGDNLRSEEKIHGYCKVGEEVIFSLNGETRKTRYCLTGEKIIMNTLTGEMNFHQPNSQPDYDAKGEVASYGPVMENNPFAALLKK